MSLFLRRPTLQTTVKCMNILRRSRLGDNIGLHALNPCPRAPITCVRYYTKKCERNRHTNETSNHGDNMSDVSNHQISNHGNKKREVSSILKPISVKPNVEPNGENVGAELTGKHLTKDEIRTVLNEFHRSQKVKDIVESSGIDAKMYMESFASFRKYCADSESLPPELHITLVDLMENADHVDSVIPFYLEHAKQMYPHLDCMEDLALISNMTVPANWYPEAREIRRKIIYHAGPTNSGKTYHALQRLKEANTGVYCGPLRMLANEVFTKLNNEGIVCDLITGEERRYMSHDGEPANHVACTVEMTSTNQLYDVAVIDEIQLLRDASRSWAWTRALLGLCAREVHVCGEASGVEYVRELAESLGDEFSSETYERLTPLTVLQKGIDELKYVEPGDCIVCFNKKDIYKISRQLENIGVEVAVIYGSLPPSTKVAMANKFNDPDNPCNVLIATDAVGMGLNLNIRRIIFYSLIKYVGTNEIGKRQAEIEPSQALQIAGRAGRYGTNYEEGHVTTFKTKDLPDLTRLLQTPIEPVTQAGLHPSYNEIELFSYHLPYATLSNIVELFSTICQLDDDRHFLCKMEEFRFLSETIEHVPMSLKNRYTFCCAPIPRQSPFVATMFLKFARKYSRGEPMTIEYLERMIRWPFKPPKVISDLTHLEAVHDVMDAYKWLSFRFPEIFAFPEEVESMQVKLNDLIGAGVQRINDLLKNTENKQIYQQDQSEDEEDDVLGDNDVTTQSTQAENYDTKPSKMTSQFARMTQKEPFVEAFNTAREAKEVEGISDDAMNDPRWRLSGGNELKDENLSETKTVLNENWSNSDSVVERKSPSYKTVVDEKSSKSDKGERDAKVSDNGFRFSTVDARNVALYGKSAGLVKANDLLNELFSKKVENSESSKNTQHSKSGSSDANGAERWTLMFKNDSKREISPPQRSRDTFKPVGNGGKFQFYRVRKYEMLSRGLEAKKVRIANKTRATPIPKWLPLELITARTEDLETEFKETLQKAHALNRELKTRAKKIAKKQHRMRDVGILSSRRLKERRKVPTTEGGAGDTAEHVAKRQLGDNRSTMTERQNGAKEKAGKTWVLQNGESKMAESQIGAKNMSFETSSDSFHPKNPPAMLDSRTRLDNGAGNLAGNNTGGLQNGADILEKKGNAESVKTSASLEPPVSGSQSNSKEKSNSENVSHETKSENNREPVTSVGSPGKGAGNFLSSVVQRFTKNIAGIGTKSEAGETKSDTEHRRKTNSKVKESNNASGR